MFDKKNNQRGVGQISVNDVSVKNNKSLISIEFGKINIGSIWVFIIIAFSIVGFSAGSMGALIKFTPNFLKEKIGINKLQINIVNEFLPEEYTTTSKILKNVDEDQNFYLGTGDSVTLTRDRNTFTLKSISGAFFYVSVNGKTETQTVGNHIEVNNKCYVWGHSIDREKSIVNFELRCNSK